MQMPSSHVLISTEALWRCPNLTHRSSIGMTWHAQIIYWDALMSWTDHLQGFHNLMHISCIGISYSHAEIIYYVALIHAQLIYGDATISCTCHPLGRTISCTDQLWDALIYAQIIYMDTLISCTDHLQGCPNLMHKSSTGCSYFMPVIWIWQVCGKDRRNFKKNRDFKIGFSERKGHYYNWIIGSGVPLKSCLLVGATGRWLKPSLVKSLLVTRWKPWKGVSGL